MPGDGEVEDAMPGDGDVEDAMPGDGDVEDAMPGDDDVEDAMSGDDDVEDAMSGDDDDVEDATQAPDCLCSWRGSRGKAPRASLCCHCIVFFTFVLAALAICILAILLKAHLATPTGAETLFGTATQHHVTEEAHRDGDVVARQLQQQVRVLCWVMTQPKNHQLKAQHVKATWGKHCNTLLIMSSAEDELLGTIKLDVKEGREHLWDKTKAAFSYVHAHHRGDADWFLKADDDTYVIVENLRFMLSSHEPSEPIYFGSTSPWSLDQNQTGMLGGPGYVLSKQALDLLVGEGFANHRCNTEEGENEDAELGLCMNVLGVSAGDSRDQYGRSRFLQNGPELQATPEGAPKLPVKSEITFLEHLFYLDPQVINNCSDTAISFHNMTPHMMYVFDFLLYHLRAYGIASPGLVHGGGGGGTTPPRGDGGGTTPPGLVHGGGGGTTPPRGDGGGTTDSTTRA